MFGARKFRISERGDVRRNGAGGSGAVLTSEDAANLDAFSAKLTEAITLLDEEIRAISEGRLSIISEYGERKSVILKWLELNAPLVEPFLQHSTAISRDLPGKLAVLKQKVDEDSELLSRMATAAGTVVRELKKVTERHSLQGLYGKSGQVVGNSTGQNRSIDREL